MNIEELKNSGMIIYDIITGSHAYQTNIATSDIDHRGIFIYSPDDYDGLEEPIPQISDIKNDETYYSLKRYFELVKDANPNILEMLWSPPEFILFKNAIMDELIKNRDIFISKKAFHTHAGYSFAQIKKCRGQNKMVNNPQLGIMPKKEDFCWVIMRGYEGKFSGMPFRPVKFEKAKEAGIVGNFSEYHVSSLEHSSNIYRLYHYGKNSKGVFRGDDMLVCESIPYDDENDRYAGILIYNQHEFEKALIEHRKYVDWMEHRNSARWIDQEKGFLTYDAKNMLHCCRLLMSCESILNGNGPIVRFEGEKLQYLKDIRAGKFEYEALMKFVEDKMKYLEELYKTSKIPHSVNHKEVDDLYRKLSKMG